jgi:nucleoside 2-deoxyribosyltransferase
MGSRRVSISECDTCGQYAWTLEAQSALINLNSEDKAKLSAYFRERSIEQAPLITMMENPAGSDILGITIDEILKFRFPGSISERIDRALLNLYRQSTTLGATFNLTADKDYPIVFAKNANEFLFITHALNEAGWVTCERVMGGALISLTLLGWNRIDELQRQSSLKESKQGFVAMSFDPSLDSAFKNGFEKAIDASGFRSMRVSLKEHNEKICDTIIAEIRKSLFLVADFTGQKGGVYFEAGYAMGLGLPVIWTCNEKDKDSLHFDTRQYNHILWTSETDLFDKLKKRIEATIPL